jgi:hypothetical protein
MRNVLYQDRLQTYRMKLKTLLKKYDTDRDDVDTMVAIVIVAPELARLFRSNPVLSEAVEHDYPDLINPVEADEHPVEIIEDAYSFLTKLKRALMQNSSGKLMRAEEILYAELPTALDYETKPERDELAELFAQMSVAPRAPKNNGLANIFSRMSLRRD